MPGGFGKWPTQVNNISSIDTIDSVVAGVESARSPTHQRLCGHLARLLSGKWHKNGFPVSNKPSLINNVCTFRRDGEQTRAEGHTGTDTVSVHTPTGSADLKVHIGLPQSP